jgi:hypothetical protein
VVASWVDGGEGVVTILEGGQPREVHRSEGQVWWPLLAGEHLFFEQWQRLGRLDLRTGAEIVLVDGPTARSGGLAVGGGWLYWRTPPHVLWQDRALRRLPLP